jgi:hypothetical protein
VRAPPSRSRSAKHDLIGERPCRGAASKGALDPRGARQGLVPCGAVARMQLALQNVEAFGHVPKHSSSCGIVNEVQNFGILQKLLAKNSIHLVKMNKIRQILVMK